MLRVDANINSSNTLSLKYNYLKSYNDHFPSTSRAVGASGLVGGPEPGTFRHALLWLRVIARTAT